MVRVSWEKKMEERKKKSGAVLIRVRKNGGKKNDNFIVF
jgi:hypothetical protein